MSKPRQRLLKTAGRLFSERGYECVGINEIIAKSEIAKATFYQHFPSKEALCAEWLNTEMKAYSQAYEELLDEGRPARDKVAARFDQIKQYVESPGFNGCPFCVTSSMIAADSEVQAIIANFRERTRSFWQNLARELGAKGAAAKNLGDAWLVLATGAMTESLNVGASWPVQQAKKAAMSLADATTG